MKILPKLFIVAIAAVFIGQFMGVANGQDQSGRSRPKLRKKRQARLPQPDDSDIVLPFFSLEIEADNAIAQIGEKLKVEVTMTNTDSVDIFYGSCPSFDFWLEVRDEAGNEVARKPGAGVWDCISSVAVALLPGESIHRSTRLDKEFLLDKPGNYFVQATRGIWPTNLRGSNTIAIAIIP